MPHSEAAILKVLRLKSATANHSGFPGTFVAESEAERSIVAALLRTRRTTRDGGLGGHRCSHCRVPVQMRASPQANRRPFTVCVEDPRTLLLLPGGAEDTAESAKSASKTWASKRLKSPGAVWERREAAD
jgi:hypothetical protein